MFNVTKKSNYETCGASENRCFCVTEYVEYLEEAKKELYEMIEVILNNENITNQQVLQYTLETLRKYSE